jgi:hypothetical protein
MTTPTSMSAATSQGWRASKSFATSAEPRSAPSSMANPAAAGIAPAATKFATRTATAVELCSAMALPAPVSAASIRLWPERRSHRRSAAENARSTPVRTSRTDHNSSAAAPAICKKKSVRLGLSNPASVREHESQEPSLAPRAGPRKQVVRDFGICNRFVTVL